ncbi:hypothetical protein DSM07_05920 [Oenococcus sp. UCMA 16435]|nr:hypothetical protein DSM07_05920 [Oenococcus sp. UCMA 16435]
MSDRSLDLTWPSNGDAREKDLFSKNIRNHYTFSNTPGRNIFFIKSPNQRLISLIMFNRHNIQSTFISNFPLQVDSCDSFVVNQLPNLADENEFTGRTNCNMEQNMNKHLTLAYSDYFPNKEICLTIQTVLAPFCYLSLVCTGNIINHNKLRSLYDMSLEIGAPTFFSTLALPLTHFFDLFVGKKMSTIEALFRNEQSYVASLYTRTIHRVPLFSSRNIYWKRRELEEIHVDEFGRIELGTNGFQT